MVARKMRNITNCQREGKIEKTRINKKIISRKIMKTETREGNSSQPCQPSCRKTDLDAPDDFKLRFAAY